MKNWKITLREILLLIFLSLAVNKVMAYPHFVGHGYTSCITCHYNPFGNGPLNDYGRALGATAVSARWFEPDYLSEEELANRAGFFFSKPSNNWVRPSFDYRGLLLKRDYGEESEDTEWIDMMADFNIVFKNKLNTLYSSATIGYAPIPLSLKDAEEEIDNYRWKEYYIGYRPSSSWGVYVGLMDKIYGIRVAEHTNYSRSITNLSHNDQSHGVQVHYSRKNFEFGGNLFLGNLSQDADVQMKGASFKADYVFESKGTAGLSGSISENEYLKMYMSAFHMKTSVGKGSAFLAEVGKVIKEEVASGESTTNDYAFAQAYLKGTRGLYIINSVEYLKSDNGDYRMRFGPGVQFFPMQRFEFRIELYNSRNFSDAGSTRDTWDFLGQAHLWF